MSDKVSLLLMRDIRDENATQGRLFIGGEFVCYTLERPWLNNAHGISCIPTGDYQGAIQYSPHFKVDMPELLDVPGRSEILIHPGNTVSDSQGCILVGLERDAPMRSVLSSRAAHVSLMGLLFGHDGFTLSVRNADEMEA